MGEGADERSADSCRGAGTGRKGTVPGGSARSARTAKELSTSRFPGSTALVCGQGRPERPGTGEGRRGGPAGGDRSGLGDLRPRTGVGGRRRRTRRSRGMRGRGGGGPERPGDVRVPEMDCPSCTGKVETALVAAEGVEAVEIRPTAGTVLVPYDPDVATPEDLREAIEGADIALAVLAGDAGMTVGVTANAMRLSRLRPKGGTGASSPATD
ncbi:MAG: heavy-metal-associated domain-containing protein [Haloarculaceae archaeon]